MNYIVFDMEWNQPSYGDMLIYENERCLKNEIIQIGAVKLDENCNELGAFTVDVKPKVHKIINKNVKKLTGIDGDDLKNAGTIENAISDFRAWCGEDFVFITWGYDDISVLGANLKYFGLDASWLPGCYNLQMIFCSQICNENRQFSLAYAAGYYKISLDLPLHNALTDAYYTSKICAKLDLKKGISTYRAIVFKDKSIPEHMKNIVYKKNFKGFSSYEEALKKSGILKPVCHKCGAELSVTLRVHNGFYNYLVMGKCISHGEYVYIANVNHNGENSFGATVQCFLEDKYNREYFMIKAKKMQLKNKQRTDKKRRDEKETPLVKENAQSLRKEKSARRKILQSSGA